MSRKITDTTQAVHGAVSNPRHKIAVVTGSRAEYDLLYSVMKQIEAAPQLELQLIVTGMHLAPEFGMTVRAIEADGFPIHDQVEMLLSSDTAAGAAKSVGLGMIGFADAYRRLQPDWVVVLGDRYEIWAAAAAAFMARIPIAHIGGGDVTEGALDEAIRHGITKMSQLHFVTNKRSAQRVRQLGEDPHMILNVGHPGIDRIKQLPLLSREELEHELNFTFRSRNVLVTYHSVTLGSSDAEAELEELMKALAALGEDTGIVFTKPNADPGGRLYAERIDRYTAAHANAAAYTSLGQLRYFSTARIVDAVIGNSSSGICEIPSLGKPSVDIGFRQKGRLRGASVLHCEPESGAIQAAIHQACRMDCTGVENPYGTGNSGLRIVAELIRQVGRGRAGLKLFYDAQGEG
ncbi:UDP-N-acetylglucosamine 2-epimerase [Paenibacillus sp. GCM10012307]|uniref:UDP-N-acetylglucosamine 2-epimerase (Hydrolyzing) n=1 Tax=Paenibacillus roseus TaxID=2798579 RepID=A0A934J3X9_9BACL|nr:UDP-N-acetylglucosamine 2-epimerase [Paenibacillus roseus]MBJ6359975.1 UDP-N-acetylglucosamine 2-epimerase (hydrolyzing) [Paenibacillus roseus]